MEKGRKEPQVLVIDVGNWSNLQKYRSEWNDLLRIMGFVSTKSVDYGTKNSHTRKLMIYKK